MIDELEDCINRALMELLHDKSRADRSGLWVAKQILEEFEIKRKVQ